MRPRHFVYAAALAALAYPLAVLAALWAANWWDEKTWRYVNQPAPGTPPRCIP